MAKAKQKTNQKSTKRQDSGKNVSKMKEKEPAAPAEQKKIDVKIAAAKGRPMLTWVGKRPLSHVSAFPAQLVERHDAINILGIGMDNDSHDERMKVFRGLRPHWNAECWKDASGVAVPESGGLLFHGDNKDVLAHLLTTGYRGKVNLIYIDPPFDSGVDYARKVTLRGAKGTAQLPGQSYSLGEQVQYADIWANDNYLQFIYERLQLLKELLAVTGFIVVHMNAGRVHYVKAIMDELFGESNFRNEIIVKRIRKSYTESKGISSLNEGSDYLLVYSNGPDAKMNPPLKYDPKEERWHGFDAPNIRPNLTYELFGKLPPAGRCWMINKDEAARMIEAGRLRANPKTGMPEYKLDATEYIVRDTLWDDITAYSFSSGYPTEKKEAMLELLIDMLTSPGDIVLDCFVGSGTTGAVAQERGRRWIGCDINKGAIQTTSKRLRSIISGQVAGALADKNKNGEKLPGMQEVTNVPNPCQFGFTVWRVNDYDLQIQHNEAVNLVCEHIGIEQTRTDSFFDGVLGKRLVKIIPFEHPLTPLDLEELRRELDARPDEDRNITLVCLGMELGAKAWIDDWNRLRKGNNTANRIDCIELRSDPKYGKIIEHKPAQAKVNISRKKGKIIVDIEDFISPTIIERLQQLDSLLQPKIDDWRAMVDTVCIDTAYDGKALNAVQVDVPEKKTDFVAGHYELPAPADEVTVAVRITDMLGEEVLVTQTI